MTDHPQSEDSKGFTFPCEMPIRIIGENTEAFEEEVIEILSHYLPEVAPIDFRTRMSRANNYCSIAHTFYAESREQVEGIYRELSLSKYVIWVL